MVFCIGALHALFPILEALSGGKKGLSVGIVLGLVSAVCLDTIDFTVPDLIGLGLGCLITQPIAEKLPQGGLGKILQWAAFSLKIVCYVVFGATLVGVLGYVARTCLNDGLTTDTLEASERDRYPRGRLPSQRSRRVSSPWDQTHPRNEGRFGRPIRRSVSQAVRA